MAVVPLLAAISYGATVEAMIPDESRYRSSPVSHTQNDAVVAPRTLRPDILATTVPVSWISEDTHIFPQNPNLKLHSSARSVVGIGGHQLFGVPIFAEDLTGLLTNAAADLTNYNGDTKTQFYQYNSTGWSFIVAAPAADLPYKLIKAIATRFLRLTPKTIPSSISSTRVGVITDGALPFANIVILPHWDKPINTYIPFVTFNDTHRFSASYPTDTIKVDPYTSIPVRDIVNETAELAPFFDQTNINPDLKRRDLTDRTLSNAASGTYAMSLHLSVKWVSGGAAQSGPGDHPVPFQVDLTYLATTILLVYMTHAVDSLATKKNLAPFNSTRLMSRVDSGFYVLRHQAIRLVMETTIRKDDRGQQQMMLTWDTWQGFLTRLIAPFNDGTDGRNQTFFKSRSAWAMEGQLFGPRQSGEEEEEDASLEVAGRNSQVVIGRWELWIGDSGAWY